MPKPIRNVVKALDLAEEGIDSFSHEQRLPPDDIGTAALAWQALGVTPTEVSEFWQRKNRIEGRIQRAKQETTWLKRAYKDAELDRRRGVEGAEARVEEARTAIREYNQRITDERRPKSLRIDMGQMLKSINAAAKRERQTARLGVPGQSKLRQGEIEVGQWGY